MKLYGFKQSRSFRIVWMFNELGIDYEYIKINPREDLFSDWFLKINPAGKVPVLIDNDLVLTESAAIITYLGDKYPESGLVPKWGSKQRARYNQWCFYGLSELEQPLWLIHKHRFILPKKLRLPAIEQGALWEFRQILKVLDYRLTNGLSEQDWILGDTFSGADILLGDILRWAQNNGIDFKIVAIKEYYQRLSGRPAFQETLSVNGVSTNIN